MMKSWRLDAEGLNPFFDHLVSLIAICSSSIKLKIS